MIFLQTARLLLRNLSPTDLDALYDYRNNEGCARYQHWENTSKEYLREWIERYAQSAFLSQKILFKSFISLFFFPKSRNSTTPSAGPPAPQTVS